MATLRCLSDTTAGGFLGLYDGEIKDELDIK